MTASPSWRQLARIPESVEKRGVFNALAIEPPPEGISDTMRLGPDLSFHAGEAALYVHHKGATYYLDAKAALKRFKLARGTPSGDLARWWFKAKGYIA